MSPASYRAAPPRVGLPTLPRRNVDGQTLGGGLGVRLVQPPRVAARIFGLVDGEIGPVQHPFEGGLHARVGERDADAGRDPQVAPLVIVRLREGSDDALR